MLAAKLVCLLEWLAVLFHDQPQFLEKGSEFPWIGNAVMTDFHPIATRSVKACGVGEAVG